MKTITTRSGHEILIDDEDFDKVKHITWGVLRAKQTNYACGRNKGVACKDKKMYLIHRIIMDAPDGIFVDHIDRNGLNNQKSNLRICTNAQNLWNRKATHGKSKYKGVCLTGKSWFARVCKNGEKFYIGSFKTEELAALAYNAAATELFGEFARLNVI